MEICIVKSFGQEVPAERSKMVGAGGLCILAKLDLSACAVLSLVMEIVNCPPKMLKDQVNVQYGGPL